VRAWGPRPGVCRAGVRPVLRPSCFSGPVSQVGPAGGLSLVTAQGMLSGGDSGPVVLPGNAEASLLFRAMSGDHPELKMPPGPRQPSERDVELIRRWIDEGAVWAPEPEAAEEERLAAGTAAASGLLLRLVLPAAEDIADAAGGVLERPARVLDGLAGFLGGVLDALGALAEGAAEFLG